MGGVRGATGGVSFLSSGVGGNEEADFPHAGMVGGGFDTGRDGGREQQ